ncbi:PAAR domain-containing protein [Stenotrophomonas sp. S39]|uniref:PAAR domain-containing protein n=1 Tax=Stenotrophomonas sp. S39 TaxID=2767451 RepID=UPI001909C8FB|nr:PAAR domain-containing protein [Stenotrophomonas sp. S39]MBK0053763.1 PAAR domain-containing protein [Stenotrophomonas sp. S39]
MARNWIVMGDPTSSGGRVITASNRTDIEGMGVARVGDKATCPQMHKGVFSIVEGDSTIIIDGQPVALDGCALACGCRVMSSQQLRVYVSNTATTGETASRNSASTQPAATPLDSGRHLQFDQAIRFTGSQGMPLRELPYTLHLADGQTFSGITSALGETSRVSTRESVAVVRGELRPPSTTSGCCERTVLAGIDDVEIFEVDGVITTSDTLGTSIVPVQVPSHERRLTQGEIEMAQLVFGDAIDYSLVRIHNHGYWMLVGMQPDNTVVAPNGEIYFPKDLYRDDFSRENLDLQKLFIHEMTHAWQYQLGYNIKLTRGPRPNMSYRYQLDEVRLLRDYNMEAQGDILADYFLATFRDSHSKRNRATDQAMLDIRANLNRTLAQFLSSPGDKRNLPRTTR